MSQSSPPLTTLDTILKEFIHEIDDEVKVTENASLRTRYEDYPRAILCIEDLKSVRTGSLGYKSNTERRGFRFGNLVVSRQHLRPMNSFHFAEERKRIGPILYTRQDTKVSEPD